MSSIDSLKNPDSLEKAMQDVIKELENDKLLIPKYEKYVKDVQTELTEMEKEDLRSTIRKRRRLEREVEELQNKIQYLKSDEPERKMREKMKPFLAAKRRYEDAKAADIQTFHQTIEEPVDMEYDFPLVEISKEREQDKEKLKSQKKHHENIDIFDVCEEESELVAEFRASVQKMTPVVHISRNDICPTCKNTMVDVPHESRHVCTVCGQVMFFLDTTQASMGFNDDIEITSFQYKRLNHFKDLLARIQAKEPFIVPKNIMYMIIKKLKERKLKKEEINRAVLKDVMKELRLSSYYNYIPQICYRLTGIPPPRLDPEQEERCILMFIAIQQPWATVCPAQRSNFLSYGYCLWQFCTILGYEEFLRYITLLKGADKLQGQDDTFRKICQILNWTFTPALDAVMHKKRKINVY